MNSVITIPENAFIENVHDINIDENVIKNYSNNESKITESQAEENTQREINVSAESSHVSLRDGKAQCIETDSWGIIDEMVSTSSTTTEPKIFYHEDAECLTSLRKIILEKILMNGNVDLAEMKRLLSCRDIFEESVVLGPMDLLKIDNMFSLIPKLIKAMEFFLEELSAELENWSEGSCLSGAYSNIMSNLTLFYEYNSIIAIVLNILQGNEGINSYNSTMNKVMPDIESQFSDLIHCPIIAHYKIYFGLKELCKYTSRDHSDYYILKETRANMGKHSCFVPPQINRLHLIRTGYAVQLDKNKRKLRFLFLFPKNLIITKLKLKSNCVFFHTKSIIRLGRRMVTIESLDENDEVLSSSINKIKKSMKKCETRSSCPVTSMKKCPQLPPTCGPAWCLRRLYKLEATLAHVLPRLKLTLITTVDKKYYHLLFFSRVEYQTWKDLIENHNYAYMDLMAYQSCINNYGIIPRLTSLNNSNNPLNFYEGTLDVYVHQMKGILLDTDVFLTLQVDYFGGFFTTVFTSDVTKMGRDLIFDQKFEILLNCSQTLRINAYKRDPSTFQDFQFFAMGTFEVNRQVCALLPDSKSYLLNTAYLSDHYCLVTVPLMPADPRLHLIMSVRFFPHEFREKRNLLLNFSDDILRMWRMRGKVFGQCIKDVLKREERKIPLIVTSCIEEIEQRGLDTSFIYVMRGDDARVNDLVAVFDICSFTASYYIKQPRYTPYDIAEVLTRYLRSLPYSILLCPNNYLPVFTLEDTTVKVRMVAFLLMNIPEPGRTVFSYLLDHMAKVCLNEPRNRVTPTILGGIFSPVILDSDVTLTLEEYMRKRNHFASILKCMIELKLQGYKLDNTQI